MPFAVYRRLSWRDGGVVRGPLKSSLEEALRCEEADNPDFIGVAEGENEFELPEIFTPEEFGEVSLVPLALTPLTNPKEAKR